MKINSKPAGKQPPPELVPYLAVEAPDQDGEWAAHCPLHEDNDPSAYFNFDKGLWICHRGCGSGSIRKLIESMKDGKHPKVLDLGKERAKRRGGVDEPVTESLPSSGLIASWINKLKDNNHEKELNDFMKRRGLPETIIEQFMIGYHPSRKAYTIPVFDRDGTVRNIRYYKPDSTSYRYANHKGHGRMALYPMWPTTAFDSSGFVITEGELDALLLIHMGIPAISVTAGAGNWNPAWNGLFKGKKIWVCYDRDEAGEKGALTVARHLRRTAKSVHIVHLPMDFKKNHGEDVTDFFVNHNYTLDEFRRYLKEAEPVKVTREPRTNRPIPITVMGSSSSVLVGKTLEMRATVVGKSSSTHLVPSQISFMCTLDAGDKCAKCPMSTNTGSMSTDIPADDTFILEFLNVPNDRKAALLRERMGIVKCNRMVFDVPSNWSVETLIVRSSIDHTAEEAGDHTQRRVLAVGPHDTKPSDTIRFVGTTAPGPKDQINEFQAWESEKDRSAFDAFEMSPDIGKQLEVFRPGINEADGTPQSPLSRLSEIAEDLADNVSFIYSRPSLHVAIDLVYHSVISFDFCGKRIDKGWLDVLIIGDTRTGKSETANRLRAFYGLGDMISCESVSFAGIFGGLTQKFGKEWSLVWGVIPINDRRMVILDEVAGLRVEEIAQLSAVRSSGIARIQKVESEETLARTRLLWLANPRNGMPLMAHNFGVRAIGPLIGNPEDIARFDFAMTVSSQDVPLADINKQSEPSGLKYPEEAYRNLILWTWSRKASDVVFTPDATEMVLEEAMDLPQSFTESPPLIQGANVRMKLARIAAAIAARLFSTDETYEKLIVTKVHARAAADLLRRIYGNAQFGYLAESQRYKQAITSAEDKKEATKEFIRRDSSLRKLLTNLPYSTFNREQVEAFLNTTREHANAIIQILSKCDMVRPGDSGNVVMTPVLLEIIREL